MLLLRTRDSLPTRPLTPRPCLPPVCFLLEFSSCISPHEVLGLFLENNFNNPVLGCVCVCVGREWDPAMSSTSPDASQVLSTAELQPAEAPSAASTLWVTGHGVLWSCLDPQDTGLCHSRPDRGCGQVRTHHSKFLKCS